MKNSSLDDKAEESGKLGEPNRQVAISGLIMTLVSAGVGFNVYKIKHDVAIGLQEPGANYNLIMGLTGLVFVLGLTAAYVEIRKFWNYDSDLKNR